MKIDNKRIRPMLIGVSLLMLLLVVGYGITNVLGNTSAAFQAQAIFNTNTYYSWFIAFAVVLFLCLFFTIFSKNGDEKYGNSIFFANLGEFPSFKIFKRFTRLQFAWLFLIFLVILSIFIISFKPQTTFTGVLPAQFTPAGKTVYDTLLIPAAENIGIAMWFAIAAILLGFIARKIKMNKITFAIILFFALTITGGVIGYLNHQLNPIYSSSEVNSETAAAFWAVGGAVTFSTGFFFPFYEMHLVNNIVYDLQSLMSVDTLRQWLIVIGLFLIFTYAFIYSKRWFGTKDQIDKVDSRSVIFN